MNITRGKVEKAQKIVVYGPEGVGKSTFAAQLPDVLFIDTEDSTTHMDVARLDKPTSMEMLVRQLKWFKENKPCKTLAIDTVDWAETLVKNHIITTHNVTSIEKVENGYGKGFTILEEQFGKLLNLLNEIVDAGIHVILLCHAKVVRFEDPTEIGAYDRWELKLEKKVAGKVKEWADALLFANYDVQVINVDNKGASKGKNKGQGGERKIFVEHNPAYDAKNRYGLNGSYPFSFTVIAPFISTTLGSGSTTAPMNTTGVPTQPKPTENVIQETPVQEVETPHVPELQSVQHASDFDVNNNDWTGVPGELKDLMVMDEIYVDEVINIVASKGFYPSGTPISTYDTEFINGMIIAHWDGFKLAIEKERLPF
ncbi:ATP-binding protein [Erysipelothrix anatis]|uniref:ATP-binding protein n=1 Tax=Erysipelothrix anatis TaxID=2683713 RepID=UPI00140D7D3B|nr:ATP-binding protein [Erysipelothrix anatis]